MELIGIPHRIVVGERGLKEGKYEYKARTGAQPEMVPVEAIEAFLAERRA
jgi:prolyl-tRNA synthetase